MGHLQPVDGQTIKVGNPINESIYLKSGDLLFKRGRIVASIRQKKVLQAQGFVRTTAILATSPIESNDIPAYALKHQPKPSTETVFSVKERWLGELYHIFELSKAPLVFSFSYKILTLASEIQWLCEYHQNAVLAAFHIDSVNDYGLVHALHCAVISEVIAKQCGLSRVQRLSIIAGAITHDIGMQEHQTALHEQDSELTEEQWLVVRQHPLEGYKRLIELGVDDKEWLDITLHHHERTDGSGYPHKLNGDTIPLAVKIVSVADTYTALVRPSNSRLGNSGKKALAILYKERGISLDASLVEKLLNVTGIYPIGALVRLSTHELGVVVKCGKRISQPMVSVLVGSDLQLSKARRIRDISNEQFSIIDEVSLIDNLYLTEKIVNQWTAVV